METNPFGSLAIWREKLAGDVQAAPTPDVRLKLLLRQAKDVEEAVQGCLRRGRGSKGGSACHAAAGCRTPPPWLALENTCGRPCCSGGGIVSGLLLLSHPSTPTNPQRATQGLSGGAL